MSVEHLRLALEGFGGVVDDRGLGRAHVEELLDQALEHQRLAGFAVPVRKLPALPAHDVGAGAHIVGPERVRRLVGEVLHDRGRFPEHEVAVDQRRGAAGGIDREIVRRALLALGQVDELQFERQPEMRGDGAHLPGIRRRRKSIELHIRLLRWLNDWL